MSSNKLDLIDVIRGQRDEDEYVWIPTEQDLLNKFEIPYTEKELERFKLFLASNGVLSSGGFKENVFNPFPVAKYIWMYDNIYYDLPFTNKLTELISYLEVTIRMRKIYGLKDSLFRGSSNLRLINFLNNYKRLNEKDRRETLINVYISIDDKYTKLMDVVKEVLIKGEANIPNNFTKNDKVIVYRGLHSNSTNVEESLSWTLDKNVALFFANRRGKEGKIIKGEVSVKDILLYNNNRNEHEVLVEYKDINIIG